VDTRRTNAQTPAIPLHTVDPAPSACPPTAEPRVGNDDLFDGHHLHRLEEVAEAQAGQGLQLGAGLAPVANGSLGGGIVEDAADQTVHAAHPGKVKSDLRRVVDDQLHLAELQQTQ